MAKNAESQKNQSGKIAAYLMSYKNASTRAGYKNAIEKYLRCMNQLPKGAYDYENLFSVYLADKSRDHDVDFVMFSECLQRESASNLSARQVMTFARRVLEDHGVKITNKVNRDLKREMKGGAGTIDKVMTAKVIDAAMRELDLKGRAIVLTLASSGARLNEVLSLKLSDIDLESSPVKLTIRGKNTKNGQGRFTFISSEAAQCVRAWIGKREAYLEGAAGRAANLPGKAKSTESDLLFPVNDSTVNQIWENALRASGQFSQDSETGRNQLRIHSFRKFFLSQLGMAGQKILAEHLAGHEGYLDGAYRRIDEEQAGKEYLKVQHVITIGIPPEFRDRATEITGIIHSQKREIDGVISTNEKLQNQIVKQQEQIESMQELMKAIIKNYADPSGELGLMKVLGA